MTPDSLSRLIVREIVTAQQEVGAYPSDEALWATPPGIGNSGGNLARHLAGNLRFMIGAQLGGPATCGIGMGSSPRRTCHAIRS